jgi:acrylyl-CoA reductase (NADPH)
MTVSFQALVVRKSKDRKSFTREIEERTIDDLPKGEILIRVEYTSLNYKDGLSCLGNPGVTRRYPHTPGIDAAGRVVSSDSSGFKEGDPVVVISFDLGMNTAGGFGQYIRVPSSWVMPLPEGLTLRESMIIGTAGYTAALTVHFLQRHGLTPEQGPVLISGATGGVGSFSLSILDALGYTISTSTGKQYAAKYLKLLGADQVLTRDEVSDNSGRPLLKETWSGAIDTVGGKTLATMLNSCKENGVVAATGNVGSPELQTSVFPFILRGVSLIGINAQGTSMFLRQEIWSKLSKEWRPKSLEQLIAVECDLRQIDPEIKKIIAGEQIGRVVVNMK